MVVSSGVSGEVAWMVTGEHRVPGAWPCPDDTNGPVIEATVRGERLWTGLGATDVDAGGAAGGEIGARAWFPFGMGIGVVGQVLAFDAVPIETPGDQFAWTAVGRVTFRAR